MLKHTGLILSVHNYENHVTALSWSPNGIILAVSLDDNTIYTFHRGVMKNPIRVQCSIVEVYKSNCSMIKNISFSPDSTKLAVAHVLGAVCVYNIQNDWTCNAIMCNEFIQNSPVTCLIWSSKGPIVFGLENGKVRASQIKTEMTWTLYSTGSPTIAVTVNDTGTGVLSSHIDGSIFHCNFTSNGSMNIANRILTCLTAPQVLAWAHDNILVGDQDRRVVFYDNQGKTLETLDYSEEITAENVDFSCCSFNETMIAVNLCGKLHMYIWNKEIKFWEEIDSSATNVVGTVTALALKKYDSKLIVGGIHGTIAEFKVTKSVTTHINIASKTVGMLIQNVNSNLVSEISLENDNGLPGSTIWPIMQNRHDTKLQKCAKMVKQEKLVNNKDNDGASSVLITAEAKNESETVSNFTKWNENNNDLAEIIQKVITDCNKTKAKTEIDYISSDIASSCDKSSFTMDFGSILSPSEDETNLTIEDSAIASQSMKKRKELHQSVASSPSIGDVMLFENLNDIPYDPTIDPSRWKSDKARSFCRNCGRLDVSMKNCPRCKDAYRRQIYHENSSQAAVSSPIRFTKQYTPEELRTDFTLQLALLASLSPGLQRILEQEMFKSKRD